jgi:HAD superfamily hydrolase (TIGR01490 family)
MKAGARHSGKSARKPQGFALFDLDYTLIPHDTIFLFANYVIRRRPWRILFLLAFAPAAALYVLRLTNVLVLKSAFLSFLCGLSREETDALARDFARSITPKLFYASLLQEIERERARGRTIILNTASPDVYVRYIAEQLKIDLWFATPMQLSERQPLYPRFSGPNNKSGQKLVAMAQALGYAAAPGPDDRLPDSTAYSDSSADLPMLRLATEAVCVNPSARLRSEARARGWQVVEPAMPFRGAVGKLWTLIRQMTGLYPEPRS